MVHWPASRSKALDFIVLLIIFCIVGFGAFFISTKNLPADVSVEEGWSNTDTEEEEKKDEPEEDKKEVEVRIFEKRGNWYAEPRIELSIPYSKIDRKNFSFLKIVSMAYKTIASFYKVMAEDLLK